MAGDMKETISALMDGDMSRDEMHNLIREIRDNHEYKRCWEHYHLIGDAMKNNLPRYVDISFASRISAAIAEEDIPISTSDVISTTVTRSHKKPAIVRPVAGFAVAASVAAVAYLGFGMINIDKQIGAPQVASNTATTPATVNTAIVSPAPRQGYHLVEGNSWNVARPTVESRLNNYLYNHNHVSSQATINTLVIPNARVVMHKPSQE